MGELSMERVRTECLERVDLEPIKRASVLSELSLRKFKESHDLTSCRQAQREGGGREVVGLEET